MPIDHADISMGTNDHELVAIVYSIEIRRGYRRSLVVETNLSDS